MTVVMILGVVAMDRDRGDFVPMVPPRRTPIEAPQGDEASDHIRWQTQVTDRMNEDGDVTRNMALGMLHLHDCVEDTKSAAESAAATAAEAKEAAQFSARIAAEVKAGIDMILPRLPPLILPRANAEWWERYLRCILRFAARYPTVAGPVGLLLLWIVGTKVLGIPPEVMQGVIRWLHLAPG
jgi:hypothetical protein